MNSGFELVGCHELHLSFINLCRPACCFVSPKLLDIGFGWLVKAIEKGVHVLRLLFLRQLLYRLLLRCYIPGVMLTVDRPSRKVCVKNARWR